MMLNRKECMPAEKPYDPVALFNALRPERPLSIRIDMDFESRPAKDLLEQAGNVLPVRSEAPSFAGKGGTRLPSLAELQAS